MDHKLINNLLWVSHVLPLFTLTASCIAFVLAGAARVHVKAKRLSHAAHLALPVGCRCDHCSTSMFDDRLDEPFFRHADIL